MDVRGRSTVLITGIGGVIQVLEPVLQEGVIGPIRHPYKNPPIVSALRSRPRGTISVAPMWQLRGVLPHRSQSSIAPRRSAGRVSRLEALCWEFEQLIQEENAVMRQRHLARHRHLAPADMSSSTWR
jgi:hypothetical protein